MNAGWPYNCAQWRRLRLVKLRHNPLCYACDLRGRVVTADTVDHVVPISSGGPVFPALEGLMSLCGSCHSLKTAAVDRPDRWGTGRRFGGIDVHGNPTDPDDAWHGAQAGEGRVRSEKRGQREPMPSTQKDLFRHAADQKMKE